MIDVVFILDMQYSHYFFGTLDITDYNVDISAVIMQCLIMSGDALGVDISMNAPTSPTLPIRLRDFYYVMFGSAYIFLFKY